MGTTTLYTKFFYTKFLTTGAVTRDMILSILAASARMGFKGIPVEEMTLFEKKYKEGMKKTSVYVLNSLISPYLRAVENTEGVNRRHRFFADCLKTWFSIAITKKMTVRLPADDCTISAHLAWKKMYKFLGDDSGNDDPWNDVWWGFPDSIIADARHLSRQTVNAARRKIFGESASCEKPVAPSFSEKEKEDAMRKLEIAKKLGIDPLIVNAAALLPSEAVRKSIAMLPSIFTPDAEEDFIKCECANSPLGMIRFVSETRAMTPEAAAQILLSLFPDLYDQADSSVDMLLGIPKGTTCLFRKARCMTRDGGIHCHDGNVPFFLDPDDRNRLLDALVSIRTMGRVKNHRDIIFHGTDIQTTDPVTFIKDMFPENDPMATVSAVRILWVMLGLGVRTYAWGRIADYPKYHMMHAFHDQENSVQNGDYVKALALRFQNNKSENRELFEDAGLFLAMAMGLTIESRHWECGTTRKALSSILGDTAKFVPGMLIEKKALLTALRPENCAVIAAEIKALGCHALHDKWLTWVLSFVGGSDEFFRGAELLSPFAIKAVDELVKAGLVADEETYGSRAGNVCPPLQE